MSKMQQKALSRLLCAAVAASAFIGSWHAYHAATSAQASGVPTGASLAWFGGAVCSGLVGGGSVIVLMLMLFSRQDEHENDVERDGR